MTHEVLSSWRLQRARYQLAGEVCLRCEKHVFPPRDICPHCGETEMKEVKLSGRGEVFSFTTVHEPPVGFEEYAPYTVALVRLDEGPLLTAQLTDLGDAPVEIGMPVEMTTRKLRSDGEKGMIVYGYKFRPLLPSATVASRFSR